MRKLILAGMLLSLSLGTFAQNSSNIGENVNVSANYEPTAKQMLKNAKTKALNELKLKEQEKLIEDAVKVVNETQKVLKLLTENKTQRALKLLQEIEQQMFQLVRKYNLYRVPVDVTFVEFDGVNNLQMAQKLNREVKKVVTNNDFVTARQLLAILRNEIDIQTTYMPLILYKEAIDLALNFLKQGKVKAATYALESALGTLEVEITIIPKPILEAQVLINDAEKIYKNDPKGALKLLEKAENDVKLTVALGYLPSEKAAEPLIEKIEMLIKSIRKSTATEKSFQGVKEELQKIRKASTSRQ